MPCNENNYYVTIHRNLNIYDGDDYCVAQHQISSLLNDKIRPRIWPRHSWIPSNLYMFLLFQISTFYKVVCLSQKDIFVANVNLFFSGSAGCVYDYVEIFDGQGTDNTSLGRFCGNTKPAPLRSSTNVLLMRFVSDQSIAQTGFVSTYTAEPAGG